MATNPDREKILKQLLAIYKPKQRLRKKDRDLVKTILSLMEGFDGTEGKCCVCNKVGSTDVDLQLHHKDEVESHNEIENLALAHGPCNKKDWWARRRPSKQPECERKSSQPSTPNVHTNWSGREGEKHDVMRARWDLWLTDKEGPFGDHKEGAVIGAEARLGWLAAAAVHALKHDDDDETIGSVGSSVTYRRYIDEDAAAGILFTYRRDGVLWVVYTASKEEWEKWRAKKKGGKLN